MATPVDEILRLHYYERQYLGAADLEDQQTYHRDMRRRHNLAHHAWGIVTGLDLVPQTDPNDATAVDIWINPGMAIDGFGREIIVLSRIQLDPSLFAAFASQGYHTVWISYLQESADAPQAGYSNCDATAQYGRIEETYQIVIDPKMPTHEDITVGGQDAESATSDITLPADLSVPYQEFPDDDTAPEWLVQIGKVNWDGVNQKFIPAATPDVYATGRSYVGAIAGTIYAPGTSLVLQPRTLPSDPDAQEFAEVNGRLQVAGRIEAEKDILLQGGTLRFNDAGGSDDTVPLWIQRMPNPGGSGYDLRIHVSDSQDATNRLSIGYKSGSAEKAVLAVKADDTVDIATGSLNFGAATRQMLNLWNADYGVGVQSSTLYERSGSDFCWFRGGKHSDTAGDPGSGGALLMKLDASANLYMGAQTRQMLNLWSTSYGVGVQNGTLYFRSDSDFCWFAGGSHSDAQDDPGGGSLSMKLDKNGSLSVRGGLNVPGASSVGGSLTVGSDLAVGGNLSVNGSQNIVSFFQTTLAIQNTGQGPSSWTCSFFGQFKHVYSAFAVLQGFSIWGNPSPTFMTWHAAADVNAIPQHVFVRVDGYDATSAHGVCFCSESLPSNETDNTVLFTVIAIGIPA
jgi:hypothetical protein